MKGDDMEVGKNIKNMSNKTTFRSILKYGKSNLRAEIWVRIKDRVINIEA